MYMSRCFVLLWKCWQWVTKASCHQLTRRSRHASVCCASSVDEIRENGMTRAPTTAIESGASILEHAFSSWWRGVSCNRCSLLIVLSLGCSTQSSER
ncbi:hypothetical protein GQ600_23463 [Phytophthora cactorum]|nr:hypothetical protein GQ600_23463 [Phytophthora cactorum]